MSLSREDSGARLPPARASRWACLDRYALVLLPVKNQEGDLELLGPALRVQDFPGHAGPDSPEGTEGFDHPLPGQSLSVEVVGPNLPKIRWSADGDQALNGAPSATARTPCDPPMEWPIKTRGRPGKLAFASRTAAMMSSRKCLAVT